MEKVDINKLNISRILIVDDAETFDINKFLTNEQKKSKEKLDKERGR